MKHSKFIFMHCNTKCTTNSNTFSSHSSCYVYYFYGNFFTFTILFGFTSTVLPFLLAHPAVCKLSALLFFSSCETIRRTEFFCIPTVKNGIYFYKNV